MFYWQGNWDLEGLTLRSPGSWWQHQDWKQSVPDFSTLSGGWGPQKKAELQLHIAYIFFTHPLTCPLYLKLPKEPSGKTHIWWNYSVEIYDLLGTLIGVLVKLTMLPVLRMLTWSWGNLRTCNFEECLLSSKQAVRMIFWKREAFLVPFNKSEDDSMAIMYLKIHRKRQALLLGPWSGGSSDK